MQEKGNARGSSKIFLFRNVLFYISTLDELRAWQETTKFILIVKGMEKIPIPSPGTQLVFDY